MAQSQQRRAGDAENQGEVAPPKAGRRRGKRMLMLGGGGVAALAISLGGLVASGLISMHGHAAHPAGPPGHSRPTYIQTPEMITNLDAGAHRTSFVKFQCKIEVSDPADQAAVTAAMPRIIDMLQTYVREMRPEELRSDTGFYRLRESLLGRAVVAVPDASISNVLFEELIVQ